VLQPVEGGKSVSVIMCVYTEARWDLLLRAANSIGSQTSPPTEIIIVVDHNEKLRQRLRGLGVPEWRVIENRHLRGLSGARNSGVELASGEIVAFLDDDAMAVPDWLEHLTRPFIDANVAGVGGWVEPEWSGAMPAWWSPAFNWVVGCSYSGMALDMAAIRNPIGASMAIRRGLIMDSGGFSVGLGRVGGVPLGCEETELCLRIVASEPSLRFVHSTCAIVYHHVPSDRGSLRYFLARCVAEGVSKARVAMLAGPTAALASEQKYLSSTIPRTVYEEIVARPRKRAACQRIGMIVVGVVVTVAGYAYSRIAQALSTSEGATVSSRQH
jgi:cellulose synthase/poly-beta-1,6-N-acetylglucosamine synthase-like glycosyltransferase